jgi:hypothetical protein
MGDFIAARLPKRPAIGDAIEIGLICLVIHDVDSERTTRVVLQPSECYHPAAERSLPVPVQLADRSDEIRQ